MKLLPAISFRYLKNQKRHTILTEVGIVLSVVLMTVIFAAVNTVTATYTNIIEHKNGTYHVLFDNLTKDQLIQISNMDIFDRSNKYGISVYTDTFNIDYDSLADPNTSLYYLTDKKSNVVAETFLRFNKDECYLMPAKLTSLADGYLPVRNGEIVLSISLAEDMGGIAVGDTVKFVKYECVRHTGESSFADTGWYKAVTDEGFSVPSEITDNFDVKNASVITYTVTGLGENYSMLPYSDTDMGSFMKENDKLLLEFDDVANDFYWDMHYKFDAVGYEIDDFDYAFNQDYLNMINRGVVARSYNVILYALIYLAILFIMFCVRMVIDNSFEISSHERIRQFGVLKAAGASKKQILEILIFEALFLSVIGIPLGIALWTMVRSTEDDIVCTF
ncbi:MAG: ABC transporter permease [Oscillospiraceae bacterium]|nr:ABC transporter permease [Oscillospiraceae bacterium]